MNFSDLSVLEEMHSVGEHIDLIIRVKETEFKVHRIILCACSSYFRMLFSTYWTRDSQIYDMPNMSPDVMSRIIQYAYTRSVPITKENVADLLVAADQFLISGLVDACCEFLESQLSLENCISIFTLTRHFYSCWKLHRKAKLYILRHFEEVMRKSEEYQDLPLENLVEIIGHDELNVKQEEIVFQAILHWINHAPEERKRHIATLLPKVRMGLMSLEYFRNEVKSNPLVMANRLCEPIIFTATKALFNSYVVEPSHPDLFNQLRRHRLPSAILLAIGGWSGGSPTNKIEAFDVRSERWLDVTQEDESPRAYHDTALLDGFVYCIGGFDGVHYFNSVRKFNTVTQTWHEVAPMYERRCYVSVTALDGYIYAMGGFDGVNRLKTAERLDPQTNQWMHIAAMSDRRSDAGATTLHGKIYICGGFTGLECLFTAECFNPQTNQWSVIPPMIHRRSGVSVITFNDLVYAVGGFNGARRLRSVEAYNPQTGLWYEMGPMINQRSNFGIEVLEGRMFAVGGFNGSSTCSNVEVYEQETNTWYETCDMDVLRSALSCCVLSELPDVTKYTTNPDPIQTEPQSDDE